MEIEGGDLLIVCLILSIQLEKMKTSLTLLLSFIALFTYAQNMTGRIQEYRLVAYNNVDESITSVSNTVKVKQNISLYIPDAFTPDGDNVNDEFFIKGVGIDQCEVKIYNRWGELIFMSNNPSFRWDGTYRGKSVMQGVYTYHITAKAGDQAKADVFTGSLSVIY